MHDIAQATLQICEIFTSIQGESTRAGLPCTFIRLSGCNLKCSYCDTLHSHLPGTTRSIDWIMNQVSQAEIPLVEITGGEPLLQENVTLLVDSLLSMGFTVLIETNGSVDIDRVSSGAVRIMDVKCPGSHEAGSTLETNFRILQPSDEVKFVLTSAEDYDWALEHINEFDLINRCHVLLSPVMPGLDPSTLAEWILRDRINVRLQVQLHKILSVQ
ncbi:MAG: 7-carboxy-7-deazaguanine synthase [Candidatus Wallbacteria bacterium HGW-Wallbacteria-1]|jgi:7-carboxy-7-deazaguanine synthase|uniref:7-carboxy-7-deazaguanine synthase n=1 Tax=Candidatus Wallbacteria bacterium HGW-Wallbacteria-1 TaxID=2013854 RepID=A0A2N1PMF1_9BACT|nr:MAG: 7-carboxy-7-deazaguanine synthase [Candidatus Wallbacteria bacterium HGW-Wallbacteria-1]